MVKALTLCHVCIPLCFRIIHYIHHTISTKQEVYLQTLLVFLSYRYHLEVVVHHVPGLARPEGEEAGPGDGGVVRYSIYKLYQFSN